jgi:hypothetical protein
LKRTFAAAVAAVTAGTSMCLTATMAVGAPVAAAPTAGAPAAGAAVARPAAPTPSATLRVVPRWTYQDGGKLAVIAGCSQRGDVGVISSKLLPRPVRMSKGKSLLIKVTGKTKPGKYTIVLLCEDKHKQPDSVDVQKVRIYKVMGAFQQPDQPVLPSGFKPDVTVSSGPPAAHPKNAHPKNAHPKKKGH